MGNSASVQTIVNKINDSVTTAISNMAGSSSIADCTIKIDFSLRVNNGCDISFENHCLAESDVTIENMVTAVVNAVHTLTNAQQDEVHQYFMNTLNVATTSNNIDDSIKTYLDNKCSASSTVNETIDGKFSMDTCNSVGSPATKITFLNTGKALANCVITNIINDSVHASNTIANQQTSGFDITGLLTGLIWPIVIAIIAIVGIYALLSFIKNAKPLSGSERAAIELAKNNSWASHVMAVKGKL